MSGPCSAESESEQEAWWRVRVRVRVRAHMCNLSRFSDSKHTHPCPLHDGVVPWGFTCGYYGMYPRCSVCPGLAAERWRARAHVRVRASDVAGVMRE